LNVITPDNYDKKFNELRQFQFENLKSKEECFQEEIDWIEEEHLLTDEKIRQDILDTIVQNIFRKA